MTKKAGKKKSLVGWMYDYGFTKCGIMPFFKHKWDGKYGYEIYPYQWTKYKKVRITIEELTPSRKE